MTSMTFGIVVATAVNFAGLAKGHVRVAKRIRVNTAPIEAIMRLVGVAIRLIIRLHSAYNGIRPWVMLGLLLRLIQQLVMRAIEEAYV